MNASAGESYQDRVRYYRRKAEQERAAKERSRWSRRDRDYRAQDDEDVSIDFDEALYNFKRSSGFDKMYSNAKRGAKRHAYEQLSFYRDDEQGYLGGVCAGIADKMNWDVSTVRVVTVILGLVFTLPTLIAYIAATVFLRKKHLAFYGRDEHSFWKSAAHQKHQSRQEPDSKSGYSYQQDADFTTEENE